MSRISEQEPKYLSILHLSDIHFSRRNSEESNELRLALIKDLERQNQLGWQPNVIVVSGDLVQSGDDNSHEEFFDTWLAPVLQATRVDESCLILCPGNHDAQRRTIQENSILQKGVLDSIRGRASNEILLGLELGAYLSKKFEFFNGLCSLIKSSDNAISHSEWLKTYFFHDFSLQVDVVNTAAVTTAGLDMFPGSDKGRLVVPTRLIGAPSTGQFAPKIRMLVTHHPVHYLNEMIQSEVTDALQSAYQFHLFGHMHDPRPTQISAFDRTLGSMQAGALWSDSSRFKGYSILDYDYATSHSVIKTREYFPVRREFDTAHSLPADGETYSSAESRRFWSASRRQIDRRIVADWMKAKFAPEAELQLNQGLSDKRLCEVFVPPPIVELSQDTKSHTDEGAPSREIKLIPWEDFLRDRANFVVLAPAEYGKTTLLKQLALGIVRECKSPATVQVPIFLEFGDLKPVKAKAAAVLRASLLAEPDGFTLEQLLDAGLTTILIDDVNFGDTKRLNAIRELSSVYPRNRFILTSTKNNTESLSVVPEVKLDLLFKFAQIRPFKRKNIRELVHRWGGWEEDDANAIADRIIKESNHVSLPLTAVNGTIFLEIFDQSGDFATTNRATLIEQFVETVLEKRSPLEVSRSKIDYTHKIHVLSEIAEHMCRHDQYQITRKEIESVCGKYFDRIGIDHDCRLMIEEFINARLLEARAEDQVRFRYRAFLEFFAAQRMLHHPQFYEWVIDEDRYLRYVNEILFYAGLKRNDAQLLELVGHRFDILSETARAELKGEWDLYSLDTLVPPTPEEKSNVLDQIERQIKLPPMSQEERDAIFDGETPEDEANRQEVFRPKLDGLGLKWTMAVVLYAGLVKNLEIISGDLKEKHLKGVLFGWAFLTMQSLSIVPHLARDRRFRVNGIMYEVMLPKSLSEAEVARIVMVELPNSISRLLNTHLATEKLAKQLLNPKLDEAGEPKIVEYYRTGLIIDLRLSHWIEIAERLVRRIHKSEFLQEAILRKLRDTYLAGGLPTETNKKLASVLADIVVDLKKLSGPEAAKKKSQQIQSYNRQALIQRMRLDASEK